MLVSFLHTLASRPWVYDQIQKLAGVEEVHAHISRQMSMIGAGAYVVDVGGGTGLILKSLPAGSKYVCLDNEMPKLQGFRSAAGNGLALLSDATQMPVRDRSADIVICTAVAHHLTDEMLDDVLRECARILKRDGRLFFLDPILAPGRLIGRLIWSLDRGSFPRTAEKLRNALDKRFKMVHWERFAVYHEYAFGVGVAL